MSKEERPEESAGSAEADNSIGRGGEMVTPPRRRKPLLTLLTCVAMLVVAFGLDPQGKTQTWESLEPWGYLSSYSIRSGAYWGYITSAFVHLDLIHLGLNLYWMWILGSAVERSLGPLRWLAFFVAAAWVSSGIEFLTGDTGIGMSGVGYALFGFGWRARERMPELRNTVTDKIVRLFLVWLVFCIVMTYTGIYPIGNGAHIGGMLFGMAVAEAFVCRRRVPLMLAGIGLLAALSILPLFWAPWSARWVSFKAKEALEKEDYNTAIGWYRRALDLGQDPAWVWQGLAEIYGYQQRGAEYVDALQKLRQLDSQAAQDVEKDYGKPEVAPAPTRKP
jgi:membrane associated rhomboid family serine protease